MEKMKEDVRELTTKVNQVYKIINQQQIFYRVTTSKSTSEETISLAEIPEGAGYIEDFDIDNCRDWDRSVLYREEQTYSTCS